MKKTQEHQELSNEEDRLRAQLKLAQGHADEGDSRAQSEVVNIVARLDYIEDEIKDLLEWIGECTQEARRRSGYTY
jgi:hypothetical protein